jgi:anti-sigma regulatory factor (Ser/Thr protein kinase)
MPTREASVLRQGFVHQALVYGSDQEFMDVALPFVGEGMAEGEPTLVAVQHRNVDNLRQALGADADGVTLLSVEQWYETSARSRDKFAAWASERVYGPGTGRVRLIGEPPWSLGHNAQVRDWARHESVINVAFDGLPVTSICPYDTRALPDDVLDHAQSTHPEIIARDGSWPSAGYEDPEEFCRRLDSAVETPGGAPAATLEFTLDELIGVRRMVEAAAVGAGLSAGRAEELVLSVNEIATNAVLHGRSPATLTIWNTDGELLCEIRDTGDGIDDVLAGQLRPSLREPGGRGLWLTRLLCDAVEIGNGSGCTVVIHSRVPDSV